MDDRLNEYLQLEYSVLKDAHFQTSQSITTFFQYAILIFSAPLVLLANSEINTTLLSIIFLAIGIVGFLIMLYLSQLRSEALLYARNINKLRNKIYTDSMNSNSVFDIHKFKVMLSQEHKPKYTNWMQFGFIVAALGVLNSFYLGFAFYNLIQLSVSYRKYIVDNDILISIICALTFFTLHFIAHKIISLRNENGSDYFKNIIGVDIDGVLNEHEQQFVSVYNDLFPNNKISMNQITTLPVHKSGVITVENERKVFLQKDYWEKMPARSDVVKNLKEEIRNKFGYKIYLFTWRDWNINNSKKNIKYITKKWLKNQGISYDKLKFERGNYNRPITFFSSKYRTRYYFSTKYNIKYFVEDSVENAIRLSKICEYVFLIQHTYNVVQDKLPFNIIRVKDWNEILDWIKKLN